MNQEEFDRLTEQSKNTISAKVIADSVNPDGCRLTTMEWTYPRMIHSEIMTHRKLSRNSASSRAIPLGKMIERVTANPVFPIHWGKNQKGMQADQELEPLQKRAAGKDWISAKFVAVQFAKELEAVGVHKQIGNRLLEPWMWITIICSATNFENLFALRCHPDAEPHFQHLAYKVRDALDASTAKKMEWGQWHLPYFADNSGGGNADLLFCDYEAKMDEESAWGYAAKLSAGRCARVSYLTQDQRRNCYEDLKLYTRLAGSTPIHASPLEHPAQAVDPLSAAMKQLDHTIKTGEHQIMDWGNFDPGWLQLRKMVPGENVTARA